MERKIGAGIELSDHCLIDHRDALGTGIVELPFKAQTVLWRIMLWLDRKAHFVGLRGGTWRLLGVNRSEKNPNLCDV